MSTTMEELLRYAELDNTELGESCKLLYELDAYQPYLSNEFQQALEKEAQEKLLDYKTYATIKTEKKKHEWEEETLHWEHEPI